MYLRIQIAPPDRQYFRFLWRDLDMKRKPRGHWATKLIVKKHHELGNHAAGTNYTLANLSARYWIVSAREEIREWENQSNECKKRKEKAASQVMGPLPKVRLRFSMRALAQTLLIMGGHSSQFKAEEKHVWNNGFAYSLVWLLEQYIAKWRLDWIRTASWMLLQGWLTEEDCPKK